MCIESPGAMSSVATPIGAPYFTMVVPFLIALKANLCPTSSLTFRVTVEPMTVRVVPAGMSDFAIATLSSGASTSTRGSVV